MRVFKIFIIAVCLGFAALVIEAFITIKDKDAFKITNADKGFAVVELFTSEGCSSCPSADAVVAKLEKESVDKPIYILAFHVDYWNRGGWKDQFSSAEYSNRQRQYARWLKLSQIYTPQVIVNGHKEFVGSNETALRNALKTDLQKTGETRLTLSDVKISNNKAFLQYHADGAKGNSTLLMALVQKNAVSKVVSGENSGRTLTHVQIVRKVQSIPLGSKNSGTVDFELPADFKPAAWELIAFVQNTPTGEITGASKAEFSSTLSK